MDAMDAVVVLGFESGLRYTPMNRGTQPPLFYHY